MQVSCSFFYATHQLATNNQEIYHILSPAVAYPLNFLLTLQEFKVLYRLPDKKSDKKHDT